MEKRLTNTGIRHINLRKYVSIRHILGRETTTLSGRLAVVEFKVKMEQRRTEGREERTAQEENSLLEDEEYCSESCEINIP